MCVIFSELACRQLTFPIDLVKARFMAGELYALSSSLVEYISTTPTIRQMTRGAEDKLVRLFTASLPILAVDRLY
jgi:hypothetical protein